MKTRLKAKFLHFFLSLTISCTLKSDYPIKEIEVNDMLDLSILNPRVTAHFVYVSHNFFSVDGEENLYFLDISNHRILKFNKKGTFITQIGSIGQGKEDLFIPLAIFVENNILYVLNNSGRELKMFSLTGDFLSSFEIENAWLSDSLYVHNDIILAGVRYENIENYNENNLISVFKNNGKKIKV